ncbi:hypothetical protein [Spartinivicinus poritis]|uniref:Uncharacterized protein n=1 Tax=Spartinivicinus poritis TaxID=2994640 RepID=A0ABT5U2R4_9GAMM|nr:hypothetical protein [Spartinivicinus sp. A2-2]MDE1460657.1 hypothetical protein [Spartinivicinus sp. A2-2]
MLRILVCFYIVLSAFSQPLVATESEEYDCPDLSCQAARFLLPEEEFKCASLMYKYYNLRVEAAELWENGQCDEAVKFTNNLLNNPDRYEVPSHCKTRSQKADEINQRHKADLERFVKAVKQDSSGHCKN